MMVHGVYLYLPFRSICLHRQFDTAAPNTVYDLLQMVFDVNRKDEDHSEAIGKPSW